VVGPAGIGKTRLLQEVATSAERRGAVVLWGACLDIGDAWPFHPLEEATRRLDHDDHHRIAQRLRSSLDSAGVSASGPDGLAALHRELSSMAEERDLVVFFDDLQWVDRSTQRLIVTLLSGLTSASIAVVGGYRSEAPTGQRPDAFLAEMHRSPLVEMVELGPLDQAGTIELARALASQPVSRERGRRLFERTGGIPLLIREVVDHGDPDDDIPAGARSALAMRLAELGPLAVQIVRIASLGVAPVRGSVLEAIAGGTETEVLAAAGEAIEAGVLLADDTGYRPAHDLFRETVLATVPPPERASLHRRIATATEEDAGGPSPDPIELAHHWAGGGEPGLALPAYLEAARRATRIGAHADAWSHWRAVVDLLGELPERPGTPALILEAAEAAHVAEDHDVALRLTDQAERSMGSDETVDALGTDGHANTDRVRLARCRFLTGAGRLVEGEEVADAVFSDPNAGRPAAIQAGALSADLLVRLGRYQDAVKRAAGTLERAEAAETPPPLLASAAMGYARACLGEPEVGRKVLFDSLDRATETSNLELVEAASRQCADLLMGPLNEIEAGVALARQQAGRLVDAGADPRFTSALLASATIGLFRLGRWDDAKDAATAALEADPTGAGVIDLLLGRARATMGLGELAAAEADLNTASGLLTGPANDRYRLPLVTLRAGLAMWRDDPATARSEIGEVLPDIDDDHDPWLVAPLLWHGLRAEAMLASTHDRPDEALARSLFERISVIADDARSRAADEARVLDAYRLLSRGELGRALRRPDPEVWAAAAEAWDRCGHPYPAAYARLQQAAVILGAQTRSRRARELLNEAHRAASALGARPLRQQIEVLAARARIGLRRDDHDQPSGEDEPAEDQRMAAEPAGGPLAHLTARELEVIRELAAGLSNREIGERLFISGRTVGVHVSNILAKLNVRGRVEAAALYSRHRER
jgi:DNA-binding CsgD family transcriptional regulator/tetratricopeptide (TPR) repeat protein